MWSLEQKLPEVPERKAKQSELLLGFSLVCWCDKAGVKEKTVALLKKKKKARKRDLHRFPKKSKVKNESGHPCQLYDKGMCGPSLC